MAKRPKFVFGNPGRVPEPSRDGLRRAKPGFVHASVFVLAVALLVPGAGCRRSRGRSAAPNTSTAVFDVRDVRCVERPEGCIWCEGRGPTPPLVEPDAIPPSLCDPKDPGDCVDFCSRLTPECAVPWRSVPSCLLPNEQEFRREVFRRDTADRPEAVVQGRITDDAGHRVDGAKIRVWFQGTAILDEVSGKDGSYHLRLRAGPWVTYSVRVSHAGLATEIADLRIDRPGTTLHNFRLAPESTIRGRVVGGSGEPIAGVTVHAVRSPDDLVDAGETQTLEDGSYVITGLDVKRYFLRASKFGWLPQMLKWGVTSPSTRINFKLVRTGVIEGSVLDAEGEGQANATVVALASGGLGNGSPIIWAVDTDGKFAQDRFEPGTYYLWARRGEMLVYPPEKIEISDANLDARIELHLAHKGARVRGRIITRGGAALDPDTRAVLFGQSPLALPRKAVGEIDHDGVFVVGALLPGRYEISVRVGTRILQILSGPREVEIPIEPGATVDLGDTIIVRPQAEE